MTSQFTVARTPPSERRRQQRRLRLIAAAVAAAVFFGLLLAVDGLLFRGRIHPGVTISGVAFGRSTESEALARLQDLADKSQDEPIILVRGENRWPFLPKEFGVNTDAAGTVAEALAVSTKGNVFQDVAKRISLYFKKQNVPLHGRINQAKMDKVVTMVAAKLDDPPVNAGLRFSGDQIVVIKDKDGFVVDQAALRASLTGLLLSLHATEIEIPMGTVGPSVRAADTAAAVEEAGTMISGPVQLTYKEANWTMSPEQIKTSLDFTVTGVTGSERLTSFISAKKAVDFLGVVDESVKVPAKKATWETDGQTATIVPATMGKSLDFEKSAEALTAAARSTAKRTAEAVLQETKPERTTEQAQEMGIVSAIGEYSTDYSGSDNRVSNIQRAAQLINNWLLAPGEVFSFDNVVGPRTEDRGFKTAPVINGDGRLEDDLGGGICQVATTLFNAAFFGGIEIVERHNHSLYIDHYPMGRDASVNWGAQDLCFANNTDHWLLIKSYANGSMVKFVLYGTPDGRTVSYTTSDWYDLVAQTEKKVTTDQLGVGESRVADYGQSGRSCTVTRTVSKDGSVLIKDSFYSIYPMVPKLIEQGTRVPETTTTTKRPPSTTGTTNPPATTTTTASPASSTTTTAADQAQ